MHGCCGGRTRLGDLDLDCLGDGQATVGGGGDSSVGGGGGDSSVLTGNGGVEGKGTLLASHSAICLSRLSAPPPIDNGLTSKMPANRSSSIVHGILRTLGGEWPRPHNLEYLSKPEKRRNLFSSFRERQLDTNHVKSLHKRTHDASLHNSPGMNKKKLYNSIFPDVPLLCNSTRLMLATRD